MVYLPIPKSFRLAIVHQILHTSTEDTRGERGRNGFAFRNATHEYVTVGTEIEDGRWDVGRVCFDAQC